MQIIGVCAAAVAIAPVLSLLFNAYGLGDVFPRAGMDASEALKAPQATLIESWKEDPAFTQHRVRAFLQQNPIPS